MATVLLGSIATFPPYVNDNSTGVAENNILQNPEIKKIIELLSGFMPTLQEAEAAPNENAINAKKFRLLGLMGELSSSTLEMNLIKGEIAVLAHNPSSNSKKVQELQNKLVGPMNSLLVTAEEMGNEIDELRELITEQTQIDQANVDSLNNDLDGLEAQTTADEQETNDLSNFITDFVSEVNGKKDELKEKANDVMELEDAFVLPQNLSNVESILEEDSDFMKLMDEVKIQNNIAAELEDFRDAQDELENQSISLGSKIRETAIQSKTISMKASQVTGSLSDLDDSITIAHNAVLMQENALNSLALTISTTPKGIPFQIQDLQNQINILREQIVDLQGQINALEIKVNLIQSQVMGLDTELKALDIRTDTLESEVDVLQQQMQDLLDKNIFGTLAKIFGTLSATVALGIVLACSGLDIGACAAFAIIAAALGLASAVMGILA